MDKINELEDFKPEDTDVTLSPAVIGAMILTTLLHSNQDLQSRRHSFPMIIVNLLMTTTTSSMCYLENI